MKRRLAFALAVLLAPAALAGEPIRTREEATDAARRWMKARCNAQTPCTYKPEHEGRQWRVWVQLTRRDAQGKPRPFPGGTVILYFDEAGNLLRRLEGD